MVTKPRRKISRRHKSSLMLLVEARAGLTIKELVAEGLLDGVLYKYHIEVNPATIWRWKVSLGLIKVKKCVKVGHE